MQRGWMSGREGQIRSVLEPMIRGYNASLTPDQQISVATWTSMKAAVFEYFWSDEPVLTAADRSVIVLRLVHFRRELVSRCQVRSSARNGGRSAGRIDPSLGRPR